MRIRTGLWSMGSSAAMATVILSGSLASAQVSQPTAAPADRTLQHNTTVQRDMDRAHAGKTCKASEVIGMNVRGVNGEDNIGSINDLVLGEDGRVKYVAVSFGGFLGMGDKLFAVPFEAIDWVKTDDDHYARIDVTEETLKQRQGFNQDHWPTEADRSFANGKLRRQANATGLSR